MKKPLLSVVVPVFNEENIISHTIAELSGLLESFPSYELIIVENGSTDSTPSLLKSLKEKYRFNLYTMKNADYGRAMQLGFIKSKGEFFANCSADWYDVDFMKRAVSLDADCVLGSKFAKGGDSRGFVRKLVSWGYNFSLYVLFNTKIRDTHSINVFKSAKVKQLARLCKSGQSLFPTELVLRCEHEQLDIRPLPISIKEKRQARKPIIFRAFMTFYGLFILKLKLVRDRTFS